MPRAHEDAVARVGFSDMHQDCCKTHTRARTPAQPYGDLRPPSREGCVRTGIQCGRLLVPIAAQSPSNSQEAKSARRKRAKRWDPSIAVPYRGVGAAIQACRRSCNQGIGILRQQSRPSCLQVPYSSCGGPLLRFWLEAKLQEIGQLLANIRGQLGVRFVVTNLSQSSPRHCGWACQPRDARRSSPGHPPP
jgi:hypothetical protein